MRIRTALVFSGFAASAAGGFYGARLLDRPKPPRAMKAGSPQTDAPRLFRLLDDSRDDCARIVEGGSISKQLRRWPSPVLDDVRSIRLVPQVSDRMVESAGKMIPSFLQGTARGLEQMYGIASRGSDWSITVFHGRKEHYSHTLHHELGHVLWEKLDEGQRRRLGRLFNENPGKMSREVAFNYLKPVFDDFSAHFKDLRRILGRWEAHMEAGARVPPLLGKKAEGPKPSPEGERLRREISELMDGLDAKSKAYWASDRITVDTFEEYSEGFLRDLEGLGRKLDALARADGVHKLDEMIIKSCREKSFLNPRCVLAKLPFHGFNRSLSFLKKGSKDDSYGEGWEAFRLLPKIFRSELFARYVEAVYGNRDVTMGPRIAAEMRLLGIGGHSVPAAGPDPQKARRMPKVKCFFDEDRPW